MLCEISVWAMRPRWPFRMLSRVCRASGPPPTSDGGSPRRSAITESNSGAAAGAGMCLHRVRAAPPRGPKAAGDRNLAFVHGNKPRLPDRAGVRVKPAPPASSIGERSTSTRTSGAVLPPCDSRQRAGGADAMKSAAVTAPGWFTAMPCRSFGTYGACPSRPPDRRRECLLSGLAQCGSLVRAGERSGFGHSRGGVMTKWASTWAVTICRAGCRCMASGGSAPSRPSALTAPYGP